MNWREAYKSAKKIIYGLSFIGFFFHQFLVIYEDFRKKSYMSWGLLIRLKKEMSGIHEEDERFESSIWSLEVTKQKKDSGEIQIPPPATVIIVKTTVSLAI